MPQAPQWLCDKFPDGDNEALGVLAENYEIRRGGLILPKREDYVPTRRESEAILYLIHEWDYACE